MKKLYSLLTFLFLAIVSQAQPEGAWMEPDPGESAELAGFQLPDDICDVDARCIFGIDGVIEVPPCDVAVLKKYLKWKSEVPKNKYI